MAKHNLTSDELLEVEEQLKCMNLLDILFHYPETSIGECGCIWAVLYGRHTFACLIGSDGAHAMETLESIKIELKCNDLHLQEFPEVVFAARGRKALPTRCNSKLYLGQRTLLFWVVVGWEKDFTGSVLDYCTWPEQQRRNFTLRDARRTLSYVI